MLVVAGLFMLYVLVQFHHEAARPRRVLRVPRARVIVLKANIVPERSASAAPIKSSGARTAKRQADASEQAFSVATFPGMRRLAMKRAARS